MRKRDPKKNSKFLLDVGELIRQVRVENLITQDELAARCGAHRSYITDIENGRRNISLLTLQKIALALQLAPWQLIHVDVEESPSTAAKSR